MKHSLMNQRRRTLRRLGKTLKNFDSVAVGLGCNEKWFLASFMNCYPTILPCYAQMSGLDFSKCLLYLFIFEFQYYFFYFAKILNNFFALAQL